MSSLCGFANHEVIVLSQTPWAGPGKRRFLMTTERRTEPRRDLQQPAWIVTDDSIIPVAIANISKSGAKIKTKRTVKVPPEFLLYLTEDGQVRRRCRRVWQIEVCVGVSLKPDQRPLKPLDASS